MLKSAISGGANSSSPSCEGFLERHAAIRLKLFIEMMLYSAGNDEIRDQLNCLTVSLSPLNSLNSKPIGWRVNVKQGCLIAHSACGQYQSTPNGYHLMVDAFSRSEPVPA